MAKVGDKIQCLICGNWFVKRLAAEKYCCRACYEVAKQKAIYNSNYKINSKKPGFQHEKQCVICGKTFTTTRKNMLCCSGDCNWEYKKKSALERYHANKPPLIERKEIACQYCGKLFMPKNSVQKYCSTACYTKNRKENLKIVYKAKSETAPKRKSRKKPLTMAQIQKEMIKEGYAPHEYGKYMAAKYIQEQQRG